jgi:hypothetical protein
VRHVRGILHYLQNFSSGGLGVKFQLLSNRGFYGCEQILRALVKLALKMNNLFELSEEE